MRIKEIKRENRREQAWGMDLIIAIILFSIGIMYFYFYSVNYSSESKESLDSLYYDGEIILKSIFSNGYPENWNSENAVTIGILSNGRVDKTKLENFYNLAQNDYKKTKQLFNTRFDYLLFLSEPMIINSVEVSGIGKLGATPENIQSKNLIKMTRFVIYEEKPRTAYLYIWEE